MGSQIAKGEGSIPLSQLKTEARSETAKGECSIPLSQLQKKLDLRAEARKFLRTNQPAELMFGSKPTEPTAEELDEFVNTHPDNTEWMSLLEDIRKSNAGWKQPPRKKVTNDATMYPEVAALAIKPAVGNRTMVFPK